MFFSSFFFWQRHGCVGLPHIWGWPKVNFVAGQIVAKPCWKVMFDAIGSKGRPKKYKSRETAHPAVLSLPTMARGVFGLALVAFGLVSLNRYWSAVDFVGQAGSLQALWNVNIGVQSCAQ